MEIANNLRRFKQHLAGNQISETIHTHEYSPSLHLSLAFRVTIQALFRRSRSLRFKVRELMLTLQSEFYSNERYKGHAGLSLR